MQARAFARWRLTLPLALPSLWGLGLAAVLGPFPFPLIGHGAAPILGFGLALGAMPRPQDMPG